MRIATQIPEYSVRSCSRSCSKSRMRTCANVIGVRLCVRLNIRTYASFFSPQIWCHRYYLRTFCDEGRFGALKIVDHVPFLQARLRQHTYVLHMRARIMHHACACACVLRLRFECITMSERQCMQHSCAGAQLCPCSCALLSCHVTQLTSERLRSISPSSPLPSPPSLPLCIS